MAMDMAMDMDMDMAMVITYSYSTCFEYLIDGLTVPEDEVHGALDEAVLEVMASLVVVQRVLCSVECTIVNGRMITRNLECDRLPSHYSWYGRGR